MLIARATERLAEVRRVVPTGTLRAPQWEKQGKTLGSWRKALL